MVEVLLVPLGSARARLSMRCLEGSLGGDPKAQIRPPAESRLGSRILWGPFAGWLKETWGRNLPFPQAPRRCSALRFVPGGLAEPPPLPAGPCQGWAVTEPPSAPGAGDIGTGPRASPPPGSAPASPGCNSQHWGLDKASTRGYSK